MPSARQNGAASRPGAAAAALLLTLAILPGCSDLASSQDEAPAATGTVAAANPAPPPSYEQLVANHLKTAFKDRVSAYQAFEISGVRWVHAVNGWNWLACVRFEDHGQRRTYAVFLTEGTVADARYAVRIDACDAQAYAPFAAMTAMATPANAGMQEPIY